MTRLLALDTSMSATGYSLYTDGKLSQFGVLETDKKASSEEKLKQMIFLIYKKIEELQPDIIVTELTSVARNVNVQRKLTMILGAVWGLCLEKDIFYYSLRATEWRKLIAQGEKLPRKRDELKQWSIEQAGKYTDEPITDDNISDAVLIGLAYINLFQEADNEETGQNQRRNSSH